MSKQGKKDLKPANPFPRVVVRAAAGAIAASALGGFGAAPWGAAAGLAAPWIGCAAGKAAGNAFDGTPVGKAIRGISSVVKSAVKSEKGKKKYTKYQINNNCIRSKSYKIKKSLFVLICIAPYICSKTYTYTLTANELF